jgi:hypothetical protein
VQTYQHDCWSALGDPTRRAIFERLAESPSAVGEIAGGLPVSRLVIDAPAGNRRIYRINPDGLAELRADLDRFWHSALTAFKAAVEQPEGENS